MKKILPNIRRFTFKFLLLSSIVYLLSSTTQLLAQAGEWTWMKGSSNPGSAGVFGVKGVSAPTNTPPALYGAAMWADDANHFWLFGGVVYNTLWRYDLGTNEWTWMNGNTINSYPGVYGTQGVPDPANTPGARGYGFPIWKDLNGDFWIYGGNGYDAFGNDGLMNDLWKYSVATNEWTWMHGSNTALPSADPVYGTFQVPDPANTPGGREETTMNWVDADGNLWFFGGFDNTISQKDDVWKYDVSLNQWVWMAGSNGAYLPPDFGTLGVPSPTNTPGARNAYCSWQDADGDVWLFGGSQLLSQSADMWKFDMNTLEWTWMSGSNVLGSTGSTGGLTCQADSAFYPASRSENRARWIDQCGNLWLFGGVALTTGFGYDNDLWVYRPSENDWTWASGSLGTNQSGNYGTQGVSSPTNVPGGRYGAPGAMDASGNLWLFGGQLTGTVQGNDLWRFVPDTTCTSLGNCNVFQASSFSASDTDVCEKFCIDFTDQSTNNPIAWQWSFPGGTPSSSTDQNPSQICYQNPGSFDVTLITTTANGNDTLTLTNYIIVYPTPSFPVITQTGNTLTSSTASNYQWQFNSVDITGATNQSYTVTQTGLYTVVVGDSNGCVNSTTLFVEVTGVEDLSFDQNISIYPNPSSGNFIVEWAAGLVTGSINIEIINTLGQVVSSSEEYIHSAISAWKKEIDVSNMSPGIYFIGIQADGILIREKLVITR